MRRVLWTPIAESDLDDVLYYIAVVSRSPQTGERIYYEIRDRVNLQAEERLSGHRHPHAPENWLYLKHKRWLVFYQVIADGVEVMRVIDAVRDLPAQLRDL